MAKSYSVKRINASGQLGFKTDIAKVFSSVAATISGIIRRYADADGTIPTSSSGKLRAEAGEAIMKMFSADGTKQRIFADDGLTALAPYPHILNKWYAKVTAAQVRAQQAWLQTNLPDDLYRWLSNAKRVREDVENPYLKRDDETMDEYRARARELRIFRPNPLAEYEPMHTWVDPNGYQLDDRIWNAGDDTRKALDKLLADAIASGMSAEKLSKLAEQFLIPGRASLRTKKPYGKDASVYAMRLARTEIARAANHAAMISAQLNPYVGGIDIARSPNGDPMCKICPQHATIDINGNRSRPPYSPNATPEATRHPNCMCSVRPLVTDSPAAVTRNLRALMETNLPEFEPNINPAAGDSLISELIGRALMSFVPPI